VGQSNGRADRRECSTRHPNTVNHAPLPPWVNTITCTILPASPEEFSPLSFVWVIGTGIDPPAEPSHSVEWVCEMCVMGALVSYSTALLAAPLHLRHFFKLTAGRTTPS